MNAFEPKELFLVRKTDAEELATRAVEPWMRTAMVYTLSEMALSGATAEQLAGAKKFIITFLNLAEKSQPMPSHPPKHLETLT